MRRRVQGSLYSLGGQGGRTRRTGGEGTGKRRSACAGAAARATIAADRGPVVVGGGAAAAAAAAAAAVRANQHYTDTDLNGLRVFVLVCDGGATRFVVRPFGALDVRSDDAVRRRTDDAAVPREVPTQSRSAVAVVGENKREWREDAGGGGGMEEGVR